MTRKVTEMGVARVTVQVLLSVAVLLGAVLLWEDEATPLSAEQAALFCSTATVSAPPASPDTVGRWTHRPVHHYDAPVMSRKKQWRFVSVVAPGRFSLAIAVAPFPYLTEAFAYSYDVAHSLAHHAHARRPPRWDVSAFVSVEREGEHAVRATGILEGLRFNVTLLLDESLHFAFPLSPTRLSIVQKAAGTRLSSDSTFGEHRNEAGEWLGGIDWTIGELNRHTRWRWIQASGLARARGSNATVRLGINLSRDVYMARPDCGAEDGVWIDGKLHLLAEDVTFSIPADPLVSEWRISSKSVSLTARPEPGAHHTDNTNLLLISQSFVQIISAVSGSVSVGGTLYDLLPGALAICENHDAKW
jgi:hypothetical protein